MISPDLLLALKQPPCRSGAPAPTIWGFCLLVRTQDPRRPFIPVSPDLLFTLLQPAYRSPSSHPTSISWDLHLWVQTHLSSFQQALSATSFQPYPFLCVSSQFTESHSIRDPQLPHWTRTKLSKVHCSSGLLFRSLQIYFQFYCSLLGGAPPIPHLHSLRILLLSVDTHSPRSFPRPLPSLVVEHHFFLSVASLKKHFLQGPQSHLTCLAF